MIASAPRVSGDTWASNVWRKVLTGPIEVVAAGDAHLDILNPANEYFRTAFGRAIRAVDPEQ